MCVAANYFFSFFSIIFDHPRISVNIISAFTDCLSVCSLCLSTITLESLDVESYVHIRKSGMYPGNTGQVHM